MPMRRTEFTIEGEWNAPDDEVFGSPRPRKLHWHPSTFGNYAINGDADFAGEPQYSRNTEGEVAINTSLTVWNRRKVICSKTWFSAESLKEVLFPPAVRPDSQD